MMPDDRRSLTVRLSVLQYLVAVAFGGLAVGFWIFQIAQHDRFAEMAENNHVRKLPLPAPRGVLFDRDGKVLVENQNSFNIALVREQTRDLDQTLHTVAAATGASESQLRDTVSRRRREPSYRPIVLIENATLEQVIAVRARQWELPGIIYQEVPTRRYPTSEMAAHLFGYVGEVTENQLTRPEYEGVESGSIVGQAGVEQAFNRVLMGKDGDKYVVVNSTGREISEVPEQSRTPIEGRRVQLTIDADIQRAIEEGFHENGYNGAAVLLDPNNGEVLALVSLPAYDPNNFAVGIDRATWASLNSDKLKPLQNRALQGRYSPGSTFKIAVATAALEERVITPDFKVHCTGGATFYGRYFQCWKKGGHGTIDLRHAIEQSCNVYFYTVGNMVGVDRMHKWATALGLGEKVGIDLPNEVTGLVPSTQWKATTREKKWYSGETISVSIGQGQVSVTPLSMAVMAMTTANGGTRYTPHVLKAVDEGRGWTPVPPAPPKQVLHLNPETIKAVHDGLYLVVNGAGTGARARIPGKDVSGKTGTAQVISLTGAKSVRGKSDFDVRDHGWFVFFAPRDNPQIAGVIFAEYAEHGANAAPIAKFAMETFFAKKEGRPLPAWPKTGAAPAVVAANEADR
jgi:penicillin-binding protein 2